MKFARLLSKPCFFFRRREMKPSYALIAMYILFIALVTRVAKADELSLEVVPDLSADIEQVYSVDEADGESSKFFIAIKKDAKIIRQIMNQAVGLDDIIELRKLINNPQHENDFAQEYQEGKEIASKAFPEILKAPLRSLKKAPRSFRVSMEQAADIYRNTPGHVEGGIRYTGVAVWAVLKGSYYLIIETPYMLFKNALQAVAAVPFKIAVQVAEIGIKFTYLVVKGLVVNFPRSLRYPVFMKENLEIAADKIEQFKTLMTAFLRDHAFDSKESEVLFEVNGEKGVFEVFTGIGEDKVKAFRILTKIQKAAEVDEKNIVVVKLEITRKYFRALKNELKNAGMDRDDVRPEIEGRMTKMLSDIASTLL